MNKRKILNDPVYGFITIPSDLVFDLIEHRFFQRLRRIKQLGLTHYVYPGALHTRFQHAIGAMHLMGQAIHVLRMKGHSISPEEEEAVRVAILLHDIGHGPYSHALEHLLLPFSHEEITLRFMHRLNREFNGKLELAIRIFDGTYPRKFLTQLVSGQLDMDRIDYLKRDSFFTGVAEGVIGHDRIIAMLNVRDDEIVVEEKGLYSIEKFLVARRIMYLQVYLHKAVISAEQMVRKALSLVTRQPEVAEPGTSPALKRLLSASHDNPGDEILDVFAALDDVDIDFMLKSLLNSDHAQLRLLSQGLIRRKLFRTVFSYEPIPESKIRETAEQVSQSFQLEAAVAKELVITGKEHVPTYDPSQGEVRVLRKDGTVVRLPELLDTIGDHGAHERFYLCYPVLKKE